MRKFTLRIQKTREGYPSFVLKKRMMGNSFSILRKSAYTHSPYACKRMRVLSPSLTRKTNYCSVLFMANCCIHNIRYSLAVRRTAIAASDIITLPTCILHCHHSNLTLPFYRQFPSILNARSNSKNTLFALTISSSLALIYGIVSQIVLDSFTLFPEPPETQY